jgi:hypothetical protein
MRGLRAWVRQRPEFSLARLARLNVLARTSAHQSLIEQVTQSRTRWDEARAGARGGPRVLIATNSGGHFGIAGIDRILAIALTLRGAAVKTLLCDRAATACFLSEINLQPDVERFAHAGPGRLLCGLCYAPAMRRAQEIDLDVIRRSSLLTAEDRAEAARLAAAVPADEIGQFEWHGLPIGEHALAGALRFFARGTLAPEGEAGLRILRRYFEAAIMTAASSRRLVDRLRPEVVVAHHAIYEPQGVVAAVCRQHGVRVVAWNPAYRKKTFIFSHGDTYHHTLLEEPVDRWENRPLTAQQRSQTLAYLNARRQGTEDWIRFHQANAGTEPIRARLGIRADAPIIAAFTNVFWDAQLHYPANAFRNQGEWLAETVRWAESRPDICLVIRVHPAELTGSPPSRQPAIEEIRRAFPMLPRNVILVGPDSDLSSYGLAEAADSVLVYGTKMAVELSAIGIPVIVAGEAWIRNKGITQDATSPETYRDMLAQLPARRRLSDAEQERAILYAHHFFFRRMIPLGFVEPMPGPRRFTAAIRDLSALEAGADPGLDVICAGILQGTPFEMTD